MGLASSIARKALVKGAKKAQRPARSGAVEGLKRIAVDAEPAALKRGSKMSKYAQETKAKTTKGDTRSNYQQRVADKKADNTKASTRGAATPKRGGAVATTSQNMPAVTGSRSLAAKGSSSNGVSKITRVNSSRVKDMGMVEEVEPKRLSGPAAKKSTSNSRRTAGAAALAAAAAMASKGGEKKTEQSSAKKKEAPKTTPAAKKAATAATAATSSKKTEAVVKKDEPKKTKPSGGVSSFGKAFREARNAGLMEFTYNGKRYTTRLAEESNTDHKKSISKIKDKNSAAYEKKIKELSKKK